MRNVFSIINYSTRLFWIFYYFPIENLERIEESLTL